MGEESSALAAMIARMRDILDLRGFRYYAEKARYQIRRYNFAEAKRSTELAVSVHLEKMEKKGLFPDLVTDLRKEAEDLKCATELSEKNLYLATGDRDDAYLDFPGCLEELFTPGGKTIKFPGFRDFLERVYEIRQPENQ